MKWGYSLKKPRFLDSFVENEAFCLPNSAAAQQSFSTCAEGAEKMAYEIMRFFAVHKRKKLISKNYNCAFIVQSGRGALVAAVMNIFAKQSWDVFQGHLAKVRKQLCVNSTVDRLHDRIIRKSPCSQDTAMFASLSEGGFCFTALSAPEFRLIHDPGQSGKPAAQFLRRWNQIKL